MSMYLPININVEIKKATEELDVWGNPIVGASVFVDSNLRSESGVTKDSNGEEKAYSYTLLFSGLVDVGHEDTIVFTEANGDEIKTRPLKVKFMRGLGGQVEFTKVVF